MNVTVIVKVILIAVFIFQQFIIVMNVAVPVNDISAVIKPLNLLTPFSAKPEAGGGISCEEFSLYEFCRNASLLICRECSKMTADGLTVILCALPRHWLADHTVNVVIERYGS